MASKRTGGSSQLQKLPGAVNGPDELCIQSRFVLYTAHEFD